VSTGEEVAEFWEAVSSEIETVLRRRSNSWY
jgi:hypothetical protein